MLHRHALALLLSLAAMLAAPAAAASQDPGQLAAAARQLLREQAAPLGGQASISVELPERAAQLPACDAPAAFLGAGNRLRPRMSVGVRCTAPQAWTIYLQASVSIQGDYYVAARPLPRGAPIAAEDIEARPGDLLALAAGVATDPAAVIGSIANQRIAAGQPIRLRALRQADAIQRGRVVRIMARGPGFVVSGEGEAMASAAPGASIRVRTPNGQVVSGIVQDAYTVEVPL